MTNKAMDKATLLAAAEYLDALPVDRERCRMLLLPEQAWEEAQERCADALRALAAAAAWDEVERRKDGDKWVRVPREPMETVVRGLSDECDWCDGRELICNNVPECKVGALRRTIIASTPKEGG
jgi:hypothetical protein